MSSKNYELVTSDSLSYLEQMNDQSIDCVMTDPPYGIDQMDGSWDDEKISKSKDKAKVVGNIPVGMKFDPETSKKLVEFLTPITQELYRVLKPGGFCLMFSQSRSSHRVGCMLEDCGFELRDQLIWDYGAGQGKAQDMSNFIKKNNELTQNEKETYLRKLEGKKTPQLTPTFETIWLAQKPKDGKFWENYITHGVGLINVFGTPSTVKFEYKKPAKDERKDTANHPTQKPVALMEELVQVFTKEDDVILDCFNGSGTTGVAAIRNSRQYIGIDKSEDYIEATKIRLEKTPLSLFF